MAEPMIMAKSNINKQISKYDNLFRRFYLVRLFTDGGYEVRVYKVNAVGAAPRRD